MYCTCDDGAQPVGSDDKSRMQAVLVTVETQRASMSVACDLRDACASTYFDAGGNGRVHQYHVQLLA